MSPGADVELGCLLGVFPVSPCSSFPPQPRASTLSLRGIPKEGVSVSTCKHPWRGAQHLNDHTHPQNLAYSVHIRTEVICGLIWMGEFA